ncbi:MAG: alcohol dehydrogenase catalytic domain-containing protein [Firmicutes bacterium]|nr:alcohol dehydrogenase catalytic domain-containing protein [Bacillota bacterium]
MNAVQVVQPGDLRLIQIPMPEIDPVNNVLVRIRAAGICGSDIAIYQGKNAAATYPRIIGHEMVGDLVREGKVDLDHQISHTFPLTQAEEAFRFATSGDPTIRKIVLVC